MSQRYTNETCPKCRQPATLTWSGVDAMGSSQPVREDPARLDCPNRCQFTTGELGGHFPTRYNG